MFQFVKKPPQIEINKICKICGKEPYLVERLVAEKSWWCKNCFRCHQCNKILSLDTYASHQGVIYCKAHHKEREVELPGEPCYLDSADALIVLGKVEQDAARFAPNRERNLGTQCSHTSERCALGMELPERGYPSVAYGTV